jgi:hypothetical protein
MVVYGDSSYTSSLTELTDQLMLRLEACRRSPSLDDLRNLLVFAGQAEQAVADSSGEVAHFQLITDCAADAFVSALRQDQLSLDPLVGLIQTATKFNLDVEVKVPEGFINYALFPESYCASASRWLSEHGEDTRVVNVIGIRSIGTCLSAVVAAIFTSAGREATRTTVRPHGSPFDRQVEHDPKHFDPSGWVLVVDEGPGLSGSSMAAVAEAALRSRVPIERICFFPGHIGNPGPQASSRIRHLWQSIPRYVTPNDNLRWNGRSVGAVLAEHAASVSGEAVMGIEDLSGGRWREFVFSDESEWPAIAPAFERAKFRINLSGGASVLWKYHGIASLHGVSAGRAAFQRILDLSRKGWVPAPLGVALGFVAAPWVESKTLAACDIDSEIISQLGQYIAAVAEPPLSEADRRASVARLVDMATKNVCEEMGQAAGHKVESMGHSVLARDPFESPSYGDGHLAPYDWRRSDSGDLIKTDLGGHAWDHTLIGKQSIAWDVASAVVEWELDDIQTHALLSAVCCAGLDEVLDFYAMAYSAFRIGLITHSLSANKNSCEDHRLMRDLIRYRSRLNRVLEIELGAHAPQPEARSAVG